MPLSETTRDRCREELRRVLSYCGGASAAMLALRDGRTFALEARGRMDADKLAAMSSSLVALSDSALRELAAGPLDHVLVDGAAGKLVITRISASGGLLLLAVLADAGTRLGLVLGHARACAAAVGGVIGEATAR